MAFVLFWETLLGTLILPMGLSILLQQGRSSILYARITYIARRTDREPIVI